MDSIKNLIGGKLKEKTKGGVKGGVNSKRAYMVEKLIEFMGENKPTRSEIELERKNKGEGKEAKRRRINIRMRYWLGRTRKLEPEAIYELMRKAKDGYNPQGLFNYLLKNHGK